MSDQGWTDRTRLMMREYNALKRRQHKELIARVRHAADINRDLTWELLAERFGLDGKTITRWCRDIPRDPDWIMDRRRSA